MTRISTAGMSREEWLSQRRSSLGGSEVGAVLGLSRYATPYSVWAEKTGRLPPREDGEAMRQGRDLEAYVAKRFSERSGKAVRRCRCLLRSDAAPYLHADIDHRVLGEKSGLECKTASALSRGDYVSGRFPEACYAQCAAYLAPTGEAMEAVFGADNGAEVELVGRDRLVEDYFALTAERRGIETRMDRIKQILQADMGQASRARCPAASISWRTQERRTFDGRAFQRAHPDIPLEPYYRVSRSRVFKISPAAGRTAV